VTWDGHKFLKNHRCDNLWFRHGLERVACRIQDYGVATTPACLVTGCKIEVNSYELSIGKIYRLKRNFTREYEELHMFPNMVVE